MMKISSRTYVLMAVSTVLTLAWAGCATTPKRMEPVGKEDKTGKFLEKMDVVEQPELEPDWADWVKDRYPNWRQHYWVDRGQWGNRGYIIGKAPSTEPGVEAQMTPLPPAPAATTNEVPSMVEPTPVPMIETSSKPTTYTVKKGDSLWKISGKVYGNPLKWPRIYHANKEKLKNPHRIYPGQVLVIPQDGAAVSAPPAPAAPLAPAADNAKGS